MAIENWTLYVYFALDCLLLCAMLKPDLSLCFISFGLEVLPSKSPT